MSSRPKGISGRQQFPVIPLVQKVVISLRIMQVAASVREEHEGKNPKRSRLMHQLAAHHGTIPRAGDTRDGRVARLVPSSARSRMRPGVLNRLMATVRARL